jgi:hypothetical protein
MTGMRILKLHMASPAQGTACSSGTFETAARLDSQAAIIRNSTRPVGGSEWNWAGPVVHPSMSQLCAWPDFGLGHI